MAAHNIAIAVLYDPQGNSRPRYFTDKASIDA